jgi:primosomal protein N' (replication factor Y) (superfamily II helicase)
MLSMELSLELVADVAVDLPLEDPLSYAVPSALADKVRLGTLVRVPVRNREMVGAVLEVRQGPPQGQALREILGLLDEEPFFSPQDLVWYRWVARYYLQPLGRVLGTALPFSHGIPSRRRRQNAALPVEEGDGPLPPRLSPHQAQAVAPIESALAEARFRPFLLWGVTASGKTEIYLRAAELCLLGGRQTIVLVPEISLTHELVRQFRSRFGERIAILHSRLSRGERSEMWRAVRQSRLPIVLGARSAIFAPCDHLGLIIVDEEHDPSYKQEEGVRYHARDLALMRGKLSSSVVLLGSATPSLETLHNVEQGKIRRLNLPERLEGRPFPQSEVVDLRHFPGSGGRRQVLSPRLRAAMEETLSNDEQILLFLNRRGYATFLLCPDCGHVFHCPNCTVGLVHHLAENALRCHYCGWQQQAPGMCPQCHGVDVADLGMGTETLELAVRERFPDARVLRMDRDTTVRKHAQGEILRSWKRGEADILIGTQMIAKGHHVPNVTLVGVILPDISLNIPDFRAAERTFQLLLQVAGRAGRGERPGRVVVQTYHPRHPSVVYSTTQDFASFAAQELENRREAGYPPFRHLVLFRVSGPHEERTTSGARRIGELARKVCAQRSDVQCLGPSPAPLGRLKGRYRWQMLLKGEPRSGLHRVASHILRIGRPLLPSRVRLTVDVDPQSFL